MTDRPIRTSSSSARRMMGLLIAAGVVLFFGGILLLVSAYSGGDSGAAPLPKEIVDIGEAPTAPNSAAATADPNLIQVGDHGRLQSADKDDPNRLAWELDFDRLDPVGPGYYTLAQPRAWVYLRDGRTLHIRADNGRVKMPAKTKQPESGEFRGHVVLRMFPSITVAKGAAAPVIDPEKDEPAVVGITDSINFDMILMELTTQDHIMVAAKNLLFEGDGLRIIGDQVRERIVRLSTRGQYVRFNPDVKDERHAGKASAAASSAVATSTPPTANTPTSLADSSPAAPAAAPPVAAKPAGKEQLYKAVISNEVTVTQTTRKLTADTLEIFARLINNQLPENAFGIWETAADEKQADTKPGTASHGPTSVAAHLGQPAAAPDRTPAPPANEATALFIQGKDDITMSWSGPLTVTPVADGPTPPELAGNNHFTAKFLAERGPGHFVAMEDTAAGAKGECAQVAYAATTRTLSFLSGTNAPDVKFMASGIGRIMVKGAQVDLGTGVAKADGAGQLLVLHNSKNPTLEAAPAQPVDKNAPIPADQIRQITWSDQADFKFRTLGGRIQSALEFAKFDGGVVARDRTSSLAADSLRTEFAAPTAGSVPGKQQTPIRLMHAEGHVVAVAGPKVFDPARPGPFVDPFTTCDKLDVSFAPSKDQADEIDPTRAVAEGNVTGASRDASIKGQVLEVSMGRDASHAIVPTDFVGRGDVELTRADGVMAKADSIRANPVLRTADLAGNVVLAKGPTVVHCNQAQMDDATGILNILSPGTFDHDQARQTQLNGSSAESASAKPDPTHITAKWDGSMIFNNIAGTLDARGNTRVVATSALQTQTILSDRLQLWLTPGGARVPSTPVDQLKPVATSSASPSTSAQLGLGGDRQLLKAKAIGLSESREGAQHATIEVRTYAAAATTTPGAPILGSGTRPNAPAILPPSPPDGDTAKPPERTLEQVFYVEGPVIIDDEQAGIISVPSAGRAIVRDQRAANSQALISNSSGVPAAGAAVGGASGAKGTSRFTWAESMQFIRTTGMLSMKKDVELLHVPLGSTQFTRLVAMRMDARFNVSGQPLAPGSAQRSAELVEAVASTAVYAESGPQRLLCDRVSYDALRGTVEASATGDNRVTLHDDRQSSPVVAKRLLWDVVKGRVEVMQPAPTTMPR